MSPPAADQPVTGTSPRRILYGRRKGRRLRRGQMELVDKLLPVVEFGLPPGDEPLDPAALFDFPVTGIWLEVGFGAGEHLLAQAGAHPEIGFIGCEPYFNGVVMLLGGIRDTGLRNIRVLRDDARMLLDRLPPCCLDRAFVLFPDPWPKTRHHKRRFISPAVLDSMAGALRPGAELRVATDDSGYLVWILQHVLGHGDYEWLARRAEDWRVRPPDWPETRYERKAVVAGRRAAYLRFARREDGRPG